MQYFCEEQELNVDRQANYAEDFTYEIGDNILDWYNAQPTASKKTGIAINTALRKMMLKVKADYKLDSWVLPFTEA